MTNKEKRASKKAEKGMLATAIQDFQETHPESVLESTGALALALAEETPIPPVEPSAPATPALAKTRGIGAFAINLMKTTQLSNNQILAKIKAEFEGCKTTYECIAWYRSKIRREAAGR